MSTSDNNIFNNIVYTMTDNIYCGIGKIPKNKKMGSMKECAEKNQIRQYGVKKIDTKLLEHIEITKKSNKNSKEGESKLEKIGFDLAILIVKIKKQKIKIQDEKNKTKKKELEKELVNLENKKIKLSEEFNILNKLKKKSKTSRPKKTKSKTKSKTKTKSKSKTKTKSKITKIKN